MEAIRSKEGWFVLHVFYCIDRRRWWELPGSSRQAAQEGFLRLTEQFRKGQDRQLESYAIWGHKADLGLMLIDPDLDHLSQVEYEFLESFPGGILQPVYSFTSLTEVSDYMTQEQDYARTLREKEGLSPDSEAFQEKMQAFRQRIEVYVKDRLYPQLPPHRVMCFYPMNKRRGESKNWYTLDFDTRKRLMGGHLITGRQYQGKVKQLVTGAVGLDDWEWGVTLFSDDPYYLKKIVYEMRYDEVSAVYGEFGRFLVGVHLEPAELFQRLRLTGAEEVVGPPSLAGTG